jgi:signal peptidase I
MDETLKDQLFADLLEKGHDLRLRVEGRSMYPFLRGGDVVTLRRVPVTALRRGDLVLFRSAPYRSLLLHRILTVGGVGEGATVRTRGDNLLQADRSVAGGEVLGRVVRVERAGRGEPIELESARWRAAGRLMALFGPLAALTLRLANVTSRSSRAAVVTVHEREEG